MAVPVASLPGLSGTMNGFAEALSSVRTPATQSPNSQPLRSSQAPEILSVKIGDTPGGLQRVTLRVVGLVIGRDADVN